jgi:hypothetical protein
MRSGTPAHLRVVTRIGILAGATILLLGLAGCGLVGVKPWERDLMARPEMLPDSAPIDSAIDDHIYFSKEASSGGRGFGGGGCGCN